MTLIHTYDASAEAIVVRMRISALIRNSHKEVFIFNNGRYWRDVCLHNGKGILSLMF